MSFEAMIQELVDAVKANTAALKGGSGGTKAAEKPADKAPAKAKGPTLDAVAKRYGAYMSAEGDAGKANVRKIVKHFGVKKISDLGDAKFDEALALLDQFEAGDDPFAEEGDGDDDLM